MVKNRTYLHLPGMILPRLLSEAIVEVFVVVSASILQPRFRVLVEVVPIDLGKGKMVTPFPLLLWRLLSANLVASLLSWSRGGFGDRCLRTLLGFFIPGRSRFFIYLLCHLLLHHIAILILWLWRCNGSGLLRLCRLWKIRIGGLFWFDFFSFLLILAKEVENLVSSFFTHY